MQVKKVLTIITGIGVVGFGLYKFVNSDQPPKFTDKWFKWASDDELMLEREEIRKQLCSAGKDNSLIRRCEILLNRIDNVLGDRAWKESSDYKYPVHGEHGLHLHSDD